ncbi:hypothetical protein B0H14DRAFT_2591821 [Mycena olivaceomarginata]|nr:hypothetical protein B0H14DRAFT_2591821 [Mycena olivaceomarginata]
MFGQFSLARNFWDAQTIIVVNYDAIEGQFGAGLNEHQIGHINCASNVRSIWVNWISFGAAQTIIVVNYDAIEALYMWPGQSGAGSNTRFAKIVLEKQRLLEQLYVAIESKRCTAEPLGPRTGVVNLVDSTQCGTKVWRISSEWWDKKGQPSQMCVMVVVEKGDSGM